MRYHIRGLRWIRNASPFIALIFGTGLLYVFVQREFWSIVGPIAGFTTGSIIMVGRHMTRSSYELETSRSAEYSQLPFQVPIIVTCLFIILMIWIFRFALHQRPVSQYLLFGGFAGFVGYQIVSGGSHRRVVPQMLVLGFSTYWSTQFLFPAGMYATDTGGYISEIREIISSGGTGVSNYTGHLIHTAEFTLLTGLSVSTSYFVLATLLLTGTILMLSIIDRIFPSFSKKVALFSALVFSISSWTLGRGFHPNKLNYFYPLIITFVIVTLHLYNSRNISIKHIQRQIIIGVFIIPAVVFGHRFSAGAVLMLLLTIGLFTTLGRLILTKEYDVVSQGRVVSFVIIYLLAVIGNPLHQGPLVGRLSSLVTSVVVPDQTGGGAAAGPGRFSQLQLDVLVASTTAQFLVFALAVIGSIWMFQKKKWEYDLVLFWIVSLGIFLGVALLQNSVDTAPQRFYGMLLLFGFNIAIAVMLDVTSSQKLKLHGDTSVNWSRLVVTGLVVLLAITSLASPIAERATSPVSDDIPDIRQFDTEQITKSNQWSDQYDVNEARVVAPVSDIRIDRIGQTRGVVNRTAIESERVILYSEWSQDRGVAYSGGQGIGGRAYLFVPSPEQKSDTRIYTSGETYAFFN